MTRRRSILFRALAIAVGVAVPLSLAAGWLAYRKLTRSIQYCGSFAQLDDELGWHLRPNASSCIALRDRLRGHVYFDSRVHVDDGGFRSARPAGAAPAGAVVAIGDSRTFGYGVGHEQTYPFLPSVRLGEPVVNAGVLAYGSAAVHLLFRRHVARLRPHTVVYLAGMHPRSRCTPEAAAATLVPCSFRDTTGRIALATPAPGAVKRAVASGRTPGGSLTAGYDSTSRALLARMHGTLDAAARVLRGAPSYDARFVDDILTDELERYAELARAHGFRLVLVDYSGHWAEPANRVVATALAREVARP